jgi:hypothetical protein
LQEFERLELIEFKKFFTYLGPEGVEGLARNFANAIKENFSEQIMRFNLELDFFSKRLGNTTFFQISVLGKSGAFKKLMEYRSLEIAGFKKYMQREFVFLLKRLVTVEDSFKIPLGLAEEGIQLYDGFSDSLERLQEDFSSQFEISCTFFEVIGLTITVLTIALSGIGFSILQVWQALLLASLIITVFGIELAALYRFSYDQIIWREIDSLKVQTKIYNSK